MMVINPVEDDGKKVTAVSYTRYSIYMGVPDW